MTEILLVMAPVFGVLALGFLTVRLRVLDADAVKGLVAFVFHVAVPLLLLRTLAQTELPTHLPWGFLLSFYGGAFGVYFLGLAAGRWGFRKGLAEQAIFGMSAGFTNTVLLGIPILLTTYGSEATLPVFFIIAFHGPLLMPITALLVRMGRGGTQSWHRQTILLAREILANPILLALLLGAVLNLAHLRLPWALDRTADLLGSTAVPAALFALGASLGGYPLRGDLAPSLVLVSLKIVLHPLLVWALGAWVFDLEGIWLQVAVGMAAMPTGINAYLFGARYDAAHEVAARTILLGTVLALATLPWVLHALGGV